MSYHNLFSHVTLHPTTERQSFGDGDEGRQTPHPTIIALVPLANIPPQSSTHKGIGSSLHL